MKHKAAIHLQITMVSCLNSHRAWAYRENSRERAECTDEERGAGSQREPRGLDQSDLVLATWPWCPLLPWCPRTQ